MRLQNISFFIRNTLFAAGLTALIAPVAAAQDLPEPISGAVGAGDEAAAAPAEAAPLPAGYVLGAGDTIQLSIPGRDDFQVQVQIQPDGTILVPFIRNMRAEGMTAQQLQTDVTQRLISGGYFTNPVVNVVVTGYTSSYVTVLGQVSSPGLFPINRNFRLSEIIARAGGIGPNGSEKVSLTRSSGEQFNFTLEQMATGGNDMDPYVTAGDKVYVARIVEGDRPVFYIYGQVNAPGSYPLVDGMSLRMALARGGGLTTLGSERKVEVTRNGEEVRGAKLDDVVMAGDVVKVGERFF